MGLATTKKVLTKSQYAMLTLIVEGSQKIVYDLIGINHPTAKWFWRETGWRLDDFRGRYVINAAAKLLDNSYRPLDTVG
jgi:hypothetical protein